MVATWRGPQTCLCDSNIKTEIPRKGVCRVCPETDGREPSAPGVPNAGKCSVSGAGDLKGPRTEGGGAGCVRGSCGRRQGLPDAWGSGARQGQAGAAAGLTTELSCSPLDATAHAHWGPAP